MTLAKDTNFFTSSNWDVEWEEDWEGVSIPPSDLYSDEPPLESELHLRQLILLIQSLEAWWHDRQDFYAFGNLTIYYSQHQRKTEKFRGPDFFVVLGTERKPRKSWAVWDEGGKYPNVIVEILSRSTASVDRGLKKQLYQDTFRTANYFWFDPNNPSEFKGFYLLNSCYEEIQPNSDGWLWSNQLELYLGIREGQLRFFTAEGQLLLSPSEISAQEHQRAEQAEAQLLAERQRTEQERQRAEQLAQKLREMGVELDG